MTDDFKPNDLIEAAIQEGIASALKDLHTCLPGVIDSFDPATQLADIQPTIKRKIRSLDGEEILQNLPLLTSVPVRFLKTNSFSITMPPETGDEVLILFCERSIDTWLMYGGIQNPLDFRRHDLSDAFAFPLMYSQKNVVASFHAINLEIKSAGSAKIALTPTTEVILNGGADWAVQFSALQTAFDELKSAFNTHVHAGVTSGGASTAATSVPSAADISLAKIASVRLP